MEKVTTLKITSLALILIVLGIGSFVADPKNLFDQEALRETIHQNFWYGAILFVLITVLLKMLFVPLTPVSIAAGYLFGPNLGLPIALASALLSSVIPFLLARSLGFHFVESLIQNRFKLLERYSKTIEKHGFLTVLFFRIVPLLPHMVVNLGFGLTRVSAKDFILASIAGLLPGMVLLVSIGDTLSDYSQPKLYVFIGLYILFLALTVAIAYRERKKKKFHNEVL